MDKLKISTRFKQVAQLSGRSYADPRTNQWYFLLHVKPLLGSRYTISTLAKLRFANQVWLAEFGCQLTLVYLVDEK